MVELTCLSIRKAHSAQHSRHFNVDLHPHTNICDTQSICFYCFYYLAALLLSSEHKRLMLRNIRLDHRSVCLSVCRSAKCIVAKQLIGSADAVWGDEWVTPGMGVLDGGGYRQRGRGSFGGEVDSSHCNQWAFATLLFSNYFEDLLNGIVKQARITAVRRWSRRRRLRLGSSSVSSWWSRSAESRDVVGQPCRRQEALSCVSSTKDVTLSRTLSPYGQTLSCASIVSFSSTRSTLSPSAFTLHRHLI